jgi:hypothetical protein
MASIWIALLERLMNLTYDVIFYVAISFFVGFHGSHSSFLWQVRLAGNSSVTKDIQKPGDYGGFPAVSIYNKMIINFVPKFLFYFSDNLFLTIQYACCSQVPINEWHRQTASLRYFSKKNGERR